MLARLHTARVIDSCGRGRVTIGLTFVTKSNGKFRFIADARRANGRANALFRRTPRALLGSMESWARISLAGRDGAQTSGSTLLVAQEDLGLLFQVGYAGRSSGVLLLTSYLG